MSSVSSTPAISGTLGIGSGLDLETLVSGLMSVASQPLTNLQIKEAGVQSQISAYGSLTQSLSALQTALKGLTSDKFTASSATSSTSTVATGSSKTITSGTYDLDVKSLAEAEKAVSGAYDSDTGFSGGTLTFTFGTTTDDGSGTRTFAADGNGTKTVSIKPNASLQDIRDAVNNAGIGITASVVNDGSGNRLVYSSTDTGAAKSFQIHSVDSSAGSLGSAVSLTEFEYDPASSPTYDASAPTSGMTRLQAAANAELTVDGLAISSASNTLDKAVDGLTFNLLSVGKTTISFSQDTSQAKSALQSFISAYNSFLSNANTLTTNAPSDTQGEANGNNGPLAGSSLVRNIITSIHNQVFQPLSGASTSYNSLTALGVSFQDDGTLSLNSTAFDKAMSTDSAAIAKMFQSADSVAKDEKSSTTITGLFNTMLNTYTDSTNGQLKLQVNSLNDSTTQLQKQESDLQDRLTTIEANYRAQFSALDTLLTQMKSTQSYLTTQLESLANLNTQIANN